MKILTAQKRKMKRTKPKMLAFKNRRKYKKTLAFVLERLHLEKKYIFLVKLSKKSSCMIQFQNENNYLFREDLRRGKSFKNLFYY